ILCGNEGNVIPSSIVSCPQGFEFLSKLVGRRLVQRSERTIRWAIVPSEQLHHFGRRKCVVEEVLAPCHRQLRHPQSQSLAHHRLVAPQDRSRHARRGEKRGESLEHSS